MRDLHVKVTDAQFAEVERRARDADQPMAAVIRDLIDDATELTQRRVRWERTLASVGGFRSGLTDLGENHDAYLGDDRW